MDEAADLVCSQDIVLEERDGIGGVEKRRVEERYRCIALGVCETTGKAYSTPNGCC